MSVPQRPNHEEARIDILDGGRKFVIDTGEGASDDHHDPRDQSGHAGGPPETPDREAGDISFSTSSRRRLRDRLHSMDRDADALFITLTYHETDPHPRVAKSHLDIFWKRLQRRFPDLSAIWKMEPQERGTVHFHLIVYGVDFIPVQWLSEQWHAVVGEQSEEHRKQGVDLEACVNDNGKVQAYMAKYMAKEEEGKQWEDPGRFWGCLSRKNLPWASWSDAPIYLDESDALRLIDDLLDAWDVDLPEGVVPNSLTVYTTGSPFDHPVLGG